MAAISRDTQYGFCEATVSWNLDEGVCETIESPQDSVDPVEYPVVYGEPVDLVQGEAEPVCAAKPPAGNRNVDDCPGPLQPGFGEGETACYRWNGIDPDRPDRPFDPVADSIIGARPNGQEGLSGGYDRGHALHMPVAPSVLGRRPSDEEAAQYRGQVSHLGESPSHLGYFNSNGIDCRVYLEGVERVGDGPNVHLEVEMQAGREDTASNGRTDSRGTQKGVSAEGRGVSVSVGTQTSTEVQSSRSTSTNGGISVRRSQDSATEIQSADVVVRCTTPEGHELHAHEGRVTVQHVTYEPPRE